MALAVVAMAGLGVTVAPSPAHAWWRGGGIVIGVNPFPLFFPPPVYYPPPGYYPPPPAAYYAPPPPGYAQQSAAPGQTCYAGPYVCPLERVAPAGVNCSCPGNYGRVPGVVR